MQQHLLHTPEGVRDIYNTQCENKLYLEQRFHKSFQSYGYQAIQTPTFEFFDIFSREIGTIPSKDLYKFFDREGNTLVLRPDITPSVARCAAKYFSEDETAVRLYYMGNTFINNSSYQGRLKEVTQAGAELLGDDSADADAEIIALSIKSLLSAGLREFQISIGHVGYFNGLAKAASLEEELVEEIKELMQNRNFWGIKELIQPLDLEENLKRLFYSLGEFYDRADQLEELTALADGYPEIKEAILRLMELYEVLKLYEAENYISFELGIPEQKQYQYYTGIVFHGYSFGSGEPIVKGGRYDRLLAHFGKDFSAIGFAIVVDQILMALERQNIAIPQANNVSLILYDPQKRTESVTEACRRRSMGECVELVRKKDGVAEDAYQKYSRQKKYKEVIYIQ
ncbi:MAG: ATP phosphoribosyltransferase regulatory subunit [Eubacterium sp.]|nr:ATP phosphoribosyltransferase regulatory subunit [Eubacterium sp.]